MGCWPLPGGFPEFLVFYLGVRGILLAEARAVSGELGYVAGLLLGGMCKPSGSRLVVPLILVMRGCGACQGTTDK